MGNTLPTYDMKGKTVIVTGANTGIGKATATLLAKTGANVVMGCRSKERGQKALEDIKAEVPDSSLELMLVDLGDFDSVVNFAQEYKKTHKELHVLVNNAGVVITKHSVSKYDLEEMFTVNHCGTFCLTMNLLDILEATKGRIVTVASDAHRFSDAFTKEKLLPPSADKLGQEPGATGTMSQYGFTKLCNILFIRELNQRLREKNSTVSVFAVHPGWVETELGRDGKGAFVKAIESLVAKTPEEGSYPSVYCACDPQLTLAQSGSYYDGINAKGTLQPHAKVADDGKALWEWTAAKLEGRFPPL